MIFLSEITITITNITIEYDLNTGVWKMKNLDYNTSLKNNWYYTENKLMLTKKINTTSEGETSNDLYNIPIFEK